MTAHERDRALYESSDWAAGVRWAQDTPKERVNVDEVQLMDSGSCGAIIHGLEDEFYGWATMALLSALYVYTYIYMCLCVCVFVYYVHILLL